MHIHEEFVQAMQDVCICLLKDNADRPRIVEPYGIFITKKQRPMYCCYQLGGYSEKNDIPNWRNVPVDQISTVEITTRSFRIRKEFNPGNKNVYFQWVKKIV